MGRATRRGILAVVTVLVLLFVGAGVGVVAGEALGMRTEASEHLAAHGGHIDPAAWTLTDVQRADSDLAMSWVARVLLVLALAWLLIGMLAARTRLVRRPGAAAARSTWLASSRPWRARESTLGFLPLDRVLLVAVPATLLIATRGVQTSFLSWTHLAVVLGAWFVFAVVARVLVGGRSPYPLIAAVGGVVVLRCVVTLAAVSFAGPGGYWFAFWTNPVLRVVYISVAFALFVWVYIAAAWALAKQIGPRRATGVVLAAIGAGLAVPATIVAAIGLERVLALWNDETGLLSWGLARIFGITTHPEIPDATAWYAAGFGTVLLAVGLVLALGRPRAASVT